MWFGLLGKIYVRLILMDKSVVFFVGLGAAAVLLLAAW